MRRHNFYRLPKVLTCDEKYRELSNNAKLLYAIILDRASLSEVNAYVDENGKVCVFLTIDEACKLLNIGHNTATKIFKELDDYGLIERKKQGFARANIIYPKLPQPTEKQTFRNPKKGKK